MKKILSILIFVLLGVSSVWAADLTVTGRAYVFDDEGGQVAVSNSSSIPNSGWSTSAITSITKSHDKRDIGWTSTTYTWNGYPLYYHAKVSTGYTFLGWSNDDNNSVDNAQTTSYLDMSSSQPYTQNVGHITGGAGVDAGYAAERWAIFKKIILPKTYDFQWTLLSDPTPTIQVDLTKAEGLQVSVENTSSTAGRISVTPSMTEGTGSMLLTLSAIENVADGDTYKITLTETSNGGSAVINVTVKSKITVTLVRPTIGVGCIQSELYSGGEKEEVCYNSAEDNAFDITDSKKFDQLITAVPGDGYEFLRWKKNGEYLASHDNPYRILYSDGDQISAEFVPTGTAMLVVVKYDSNGTPITDGKEYFSLKDAIAATNSTFNTIVVMKSGSLYNLDFSTASDGKKEITIPSGVTLLVPGDAKYTKRTALTEDDIVEYESTPTRYSYLSIPQGTRIKASGNICVYSPLSYTMGHNGKPKSYGQIIMGDNTQIELNAGSYLTVFGYISGTPETSQVIANAGSYVYEAFQMTDWRGGLATYTIKDNTQRVFPLEQFYIQSIETKLTLKRGATEYVSSGVNVSALGQFINVHLNMKFIGQSTSVGAEDEGFFCLGEDTQLSKWYDKTNDRQVYKVEGTVTGAWAKIGVMNLNIQKVPTIDVSSKKFVLPATSNMDINVHNITVYSMYDLALLADATMYIAPDATFITQGNMFIYDKEHNTGYFYSDNSLLRPIQYTAAHGKDPGIRTSTLNTTDELDPKKVDDARLIVDGQFQVKMFTETDASSYDGTGLYTTALGGNGTSQNDADYGAFITSNGGGKVFFGVKGTNKSETFQAHQTDNSVDYFISIPVSNARLRNDDNSYSAGANANPGEEYTYSQSKQKWVLPQEVSFGSFDGKDFLVRLPEPSMVSHDLVVNMITDDVLSMENFDITLPTNPYFTKGEATYDAANKQLIIPITYKLTGKHNLGTPNTQDITIVCKDANLGGELDSKTITLSAVEDYTPEFTVAINNPNEISNGIYKFETTTALATSEAVLMITPNQKTTAKLLDASKWTITATPNKPFAATLKEYPNYTLSFNPQESDDYNGTLTVVATYNDGTKDVPSLPVEITLQGLATKQPNNLLFNDITTIYQGQKIENIFSSLGSLLDFSEITYTYQDGTGASGLVQLSGSVAENYDLQAFEPNSPAITEAKIVTITVKQPSSNIMEGTGDKGKSITITVLPPVIWNWSDLYFGGDYENPVVLSDIITPWTLTKKTDADNLVEFSGEPGTYKAVINNSNSDQIHQAVFTFQQGSYTKDLVSNIYTDPRVLGYCVEGDHQFRGVSTNNSTVTYNAASKTATFRPSAVWELNMIGIPDKLTFTASGDKVWYISERDNESSNYTSIISSSILTGNQTIQLKPTTSQVKIEYGAGTGNNGSISNLCISELELSSSHDVVYFPINKDNTTSTKSIVLTHTGSETPNFTYDDNEFDIHATTSGNLGTTDEPYYETTVQISGSSATVSVGTHELSAKQGSTTIDVTIYADEFPQGLPIRLAEDDVKRYHFLAAESRFTKWDDANRQIVFQDPLSSNVTRFVTMYFEGAPSRVMFTSAENTGWAIEESVTGADDSYNPCAYEMTDGKLQAQLHYTSRYVRIKYHSAGRNEVSLSDLIIEGDPMLLVNPDELEYSDEDRNKDKPLTLTTINLNKIKVVLENAVDFSMTHGSAAASTEYVLTSDDYPLALGTNKVGNIVINTRWITSSMANDGVISIYNVTNAGDVLMKKVMMVAAGEYLRIEDAAKTGIYTGIPDGTKDMNGDGEISSEEAAYKFTFHGTDYTDYKYHQVDLSNAFDPNGTALFDYLIVYGETTPSTGSNITAPSGENGSNARTPYYVYERSLNADGEYDRYRIIQTILNANDVENSKKHIDGLTETDSEGFTSFINVNENESKSIYITGFCPYASTGSTFYDEGVWYFRGHHGSKLDVYLEDCYIFSRNKTNNGKPFYARGHQDNPVFNKIYAQGSGAVLAFECLDLSKNVVVEKAFDVTIHTIGENLLKSNYGCFYDFFNMDPFQISAPVHVRLHSKEHARKSKTSVTFDDLWPRTADALSGEIIKTTRTNGFLSLQKMNNNAPSIDLGSPNTVVNFKGGRVELQNAQIVSTNYKTTLAISYRAGEYGGDKVGFTFAEGIGTDAVDGEVNFYDGTITVIPMWVSEEYKQYYLIDKDELGNDITRTITKNGKEVTEYQTTCLRCPKNTEVYGGSICRVRSCQHVTSKGGAPTLSGKYLGQYIYKIQSDDVVDANGLATQISFPEGVTDANNNPVTAFYEIYHPNDMYGKESVAPDDKDQLYFWIPDGYGNVNAEEDKFLTTWKTCMTSITAGMEGIKGSVGGPTPVEANEGIKYMLYCKIDENISNVITAGDGEGDDRVYSYKAPIKVPPVAQTDLGKYIEREPMSVGTELQNEVLSEIPYTVTDKVYYIATAKADIWQTFTAPFDVAKIWVVETYDENTLKETGIKTDNKGMKLSKYESILLEQAKHNADFAAFFGVAMAIGSTDPFNTIFEDWREWGKFQDQRTQDSEGNPLTPLYTSGTYNLRGKYELVPFMGDNWDRANFYLNHNNGNWIYDDTKTENEAFEVKWETLTDDDLSDGILLHQGETYSMLFPYCTGCWEDGARPYDMWDYWSGKFLIFESTQRTEDNPHTIQGSNYVAATKVEDQDWVFDGVVSGQEAIVTGNSTFAYMTTDQENVFFYDDYAGDEMFILGGDSIYPTTSFLYADIPANQFGMPAKKVTRDGKIIYGGSGNNNGDPNGGVTTGTHTPTIGGGNDMFITAIDGGINIAVAAPQNIYVVNATGHIIFNGYVTTNTNVLLPMNGIYVVKGQNEVQKIFF